MMEGKVTIRGVEWEFLTRYDDKCCHTFHPVELSERGVYSKLGLAVDGRAGYIGHFDTWGEAFEAAVIISTLTNPVNYVEAWS